MLGLEGRAGEIAAGAAANLVVSTGTALRATRRSSTATWVDGDSLRRQAEERRRHRHVSARRRPRRRAQRPAHGAALGRRERRRGPPVPATSVARHGQRLEFEIDGTPFGTPRLQRATATVEGDVLKLELVPPRAARPSRGSPERDRRGARREGFPHGRRDGPSAVERRRRPRPRSRTLPIPTCARCRSASPQPLLAPKAVLVKNATIWTSGPQGTLANANLLVVDGKITAVGKDVTAPAGCERWSDRRAGPRVTPGLIDCHATRRSTAASTRARATSRPKCASTTSSIPTTSRSTASSPAASRRRTSCTARPTRSAARRRSSSCAGARADAEPSARDAPPGIKFALGENPKQSNSARPPHALPADAHGRRGDDPRRVPRGARLPRADGTPTTSRSERARPRSRRAAICSSRRSPRSSTASASCTATATAQRRDPHAHADLPRSSASQVATLPARARGLQGGRRDRRTRRGRVDVRDWWAYKFEVYDAIPYNGALMHERGVVVSFNSDTRRARAPPELSRPPRP